MLLANRKKTTERAAPSSRTWMSPARKSITGSPFASLAATVSLTRLWWESDLALDCANASDAQAHQIITKTADIRLIPNLRSGKCLKRAASTFVSTAIILYRSDSKLQSPSGDWPRPRRGLRQSRQIVSSPRRCASGLFRWGRAACNSTAAISHPTWLKQTLHLP